MSRDTRCYFKQMESIWKTNIHLVLHFLKTLKFIGEAISVVFLSDDCFWMNGFFYCIAYMELIRVFRIKDRYDQTYEKN